jgi:hypothetical protein
MTEREIMRLLHMGCGEPLRAVLDRVVRSAASGKAAAGTGEHGAPRKQEERKDK